ncbi:MAG: hypothetical protein ACK53Y_22685 [bacterium]
MFEIKGKNENCQNSQFLCKILKDFRKFQSDRKFMKAECEYTVPRELAQKMLSYFEDFITLCSALHFAYWWQQKSYLPELCEELSAGAT